MKRQQALVARPLDLTLDTADRLRLDPEWLKSIDLHLHVPRGGSARDAASAGVAMFVAVTSLLLRAPVKPDVAVAGELTLRGTVLPVGGIKDQVLAAHRAGIREIVQQELDLSGGDPNVVTEAKIRLVMTARRLLADTRISLGEQK